mmetsp:Transcript_47841/g.136232  ORF Transcript_47841/g.136232 Transcript_47841/m.136232 type:complete len:283 (+) Transcript_47841:88-936(+)
MRALLPGAAAALRSARGCSQWPSCDWKGRSFTSIRLSEAQVEAYRRDGFLLPGFQLEADHLASARRALDELLERNPDVMPEQLVNSHLADGEGEAQGVRGSAEFLKLAAHTPLVELVAQCLGTENVILWACQIFCKLPGEGKAVPFHQDGQYWPIEPLRACTAWIALDRSDAQNGALQVLPGTHSKSYVEHIQREDEEACISFIADPEAVAPQRPKATMLELEPGQVSLHDSMLLHGSERNLSRRRRAGVAAVYMPAECHFNREVETEGANQNPNNTLLRTL